MKMMIICQGAMSYRLLCYCKLLFIVSFLRLNAGSVDLMKKILQTRSFFTEEYGTIAKQATLQYSSSNTHLLFNFSKSLATQLTN
jgi:hypothetical protein